MPRYLHLARLALFVMVWITLWSAGCTTHKETSHASVIPYYDTAEKIKAMPACQATAGRAGSHWTSFHTVDGVKFCIGSPGATEEVRGFLQTLREGKMYHLPGDFLVYQKSTNKGLTAL